MRALTGIMPLGIFGIAGIVAMVAIAFIGAPALGASGRLVADLSRENVDITSGYHGTDLLLFGAYEGEPGDDLVVIVRGPSTDIIQRRKENRLGIWVNVETLVWQNAPAFYHLFSTRKLGDIASRQVLRQTRVGTDSLDLRRVARVAGPGNGHHGQSEQPVIPQVAYRGTTRQMEGLMRNMHNDGLWATRPDSIERQQDTLFRVELALPSNVPTGSYIIRVLHFRDGVALSERTTDMNVAKAGVSGLIYRFAHEQSLFYGIFAVCFAVAAGFLAAVAFRRK